MESQNPNSGQLRIASGTSVSESSVMGFNSKDSKLQESKALSEKVYQAIVRPAVNQGTTVELQKKIGETLLSQSRYMRQPNFQRSSNADLLTLAELYDQHYFNGSLLPLARIHGMDFRWSSRMTRAGGKTTRTVQWNRKQGTRSTNYEIALSSTLLFQTFRDLSRPIRVTGVDCTNRLEAMQRIMEHELIHLTEMLLWTDSCCAAKRFQNIAYRLFGHTEHRHELVTPRERAASEFNVRVGSRVTFRSEGKQYCGIVNRITRRATILVEDPAGERYSDGHRYRKFYVPLSMLSVAS
jgi:hypothetical protein